MDFKLIFAIVILLILISIQYTLNLILKEIKGIRLSLMNKNYNEDESDLYGR